MLNKYVPTPSNRGAEVIVSFQSTCYLSLASVNVAQLDIPIIRRSILLVNTMRIKRGKYARRLRHIARTDLLDASKVTLLPRKCSNTKHGARSRGLFLEALTPRLLSLHLVQGLGPYGLIGDTQRLLQVRFLMPILSLQYFADDTPTTASPADMKRRNLLEQDPSSNLQNLPQLLASFSHKMGCVLH